VITDTDHYAPGRGNALWAWKSFLRGHHPILMDFGIIAGVRPPDPSAGPMPYAAFEPARYAMGDTVRFAERIDLAHMVPRGDPSSTDLALANEGREYLILQPESIAPVSVTLERGSYAVEWFSIEKRRSSIGDVVIVQEPRSIRLSAPQDAPAPAVVYLKRTG
jgi:hypothetical protein